ncbi:ATP binding protein [Pelomyxa schiedti]|nr:ATP binding protein [Pelomyxa schiedti]
MSAKYGAVSNVPASQYQARQPPSQVPPSPPSHNPATSISLTSYAYSSPSGVAMATASAAAMTSINQREPKKHIKLNTKVTKKQQPQDLQNQQQQYFQQMNFQQQQYAMSQQQQQQQQIQSLGRGGRASSPDQQMVAVSPYGVYPTMTPMVAPQVGSAIMVPTAYYTPQPQPQQQQQIMGYGGVPQRVISPPRGSSPLTRPESPNPLVMAQPTASSSPLLPIVDSANRATSPSFMYSQLSSYGAVPSVPPSQPQQLSASSPTSLAVQGGTSSAPSSPVQRVDEARQPLHQLYNVHSGFRGVIVELNLSPHVHSPLGGNAPNPEQMQLRDPRGTVLLRSPFEGEKTACFKPEYVESGGMRVFYGDELIFDLKRGRSSRLHALSVAVLRFTDTPCHRTWGDIPPGGDQFHGFLQKLESLDPTTLQLARSCPAVLQLVSSQCTSTTVIFLCGFVCSILGLSHHDTEFWSPIVCSNILPSLLSTTGPLLREGDTITMNNLPKIKTMATLIAGTSGARMLSSLLEAIVRCHKNEKENTATNSVSSSDEPVSEFLLGLFRCSHPLQRSDPISMFDWQQLPLVPTNDELFACDLSELSNTLKSLPEVRTNTPYPSVHNYLETYFRLYRADCFMNLSKYIEPLINPTSSHKFDPRDIAVFDTLILRGVDTTDSRELVYILRCRPRSTLCVRFQNLSFGNLLALSLDGSFRDVIWVTLASSVSTTVRKDIRSANKDNPPFLDLKVVFCTKANGGVDAEITAAHSLACGNHCALLVENPVFFLAYEPVLSSIHNLNQLRPLPFADELCFCKLPEARSEPVKAPTTATRPLEPLPTLAVSKITDCFTFSSTPAQAIKLDFWGVSTGASTTGNSNNKLSEIPPSASILPSKLQVPSPTLVPSLTRTATTSCVVSPSSSATNAAVQNAVVPPSHNTILSDTKALQDLLSSEPDVFGTFDPQQRDAFLDFTVRRLSLTQGPPGTGKSYLGSRIAYALACLSERSKKWEGPILVMSYKNHALDELLVDIKHLLDTKFPRSKEGAYSMIARLGRSPKMDAEVSRFTLENLYATVRANRELPMPIRSQFSFAIEAVKKALKEVEALMNLLTQSLHGMTLMDFPEFDKAIPPEEEWNAQIWLNNTLNSIEADLTQRESNIKGVSGVELEAETRGTDLEDEEDEERKAEDEERMAAVGLSSKRKKRLNQQQTGTIFNLANLAYHYQNMFPDFKDTEIPSRLPLYDPVPFLIKILLIRHDYCVSKIKVALKEYTSCLNRVHTSSVLVNAYTLRHNDNVDKRVSVVGCTIVGAAIHHDTIAAISPSALIIEEAAEIAEPALLGTLFPSLKRIIMIGDHKQLRATVECHSLETLKHLDVSAFERLINNNYPVVTLLTQNRMLESLLTPVLLHYSRLESNLERVSKLKPEPWLQKPLFWWTHSEFEDSHNTLGRSRLNSYEANRAITLISFLLLQGTPPQDITFLTPYVGQLMEMKALQKRFHALNPLLGLKEVQAHTVDEFQGDENNIIILSQVRSAPPNSPPSIGFLRQVNRQIVATSRQKIALIIIGNHSTFSFSPEWKRLIELLQATSQAEGGCVLKELPLICPRHKKVIRLDQPLQSVGNLTGCGEVCGAKLPCGHFCKGKCHGPETNHFKCKELVTAQFECGHTRSVMCGAQLKQKCYEKVPVCPPCGHKTVCLCYKKDKYVCFFPCTKKNPSCKHQCLLRCGVPCNSRSCKICVTTLMERLLPTMRRKMNRRIKKGKVPPQKEGSLNEKERAMLLASIHSLQLGTPHSLTDEEWYSLLDSLSPSDFFEPLGQDHFLSNGDGLNELEAYEKVWKIITTQMNIRIPSAWSITPLCQGYLALREALVPDALKELREVFNTLLHVSEDTEEEEFVDDNSNKPERIYKKIPHILSSAIRRTHDVLLDYITGQNNIASKRYSHYQDFVTEDLPTLAHKLTSSLHADNLSFLSKEALSIARKWGLPVGSLKQEFILHPELCPPHLELEKRSLYIPENHDMAFITIDIRRAGFTVLSLTTPSVVAYSEKWEDFVENVIAQHQQSTRETLLPDVIQHFKAMRTALLGKLCHKKNAMLQSHILRLIARAILNYCSARDFPEEDVKHIKTIFRFSCDELIIVCQKPKNSWKTLEIVKDSIAEFFPKVSNIIKVESMRLACILFTEHMEQTPPPEEHEPDEDVIRPGHILLKNKYIEPESVIDESWEEPQADCVPVNPGASLSQTAPDEKVSFVDTPTGDPPEMQPINNAEPPKRNIFFVRVGSTKVFDIKQIPQWNLVEGLSIVYHLRENLQKEDWPKNWFNPDTSLEVELQDNLEELPDTPPPTVESPPVNSPVIVKSTKARHFFTHKTADARTLVASLKSKNGSMSIQKDIESRTDKQEYCSNILSQVLPFSSELMQNQFANHAFQLILKEVPETLITQALQQINGHLADIATHTYGHYSFKTILGLVKTSEQMQVIASSLKTHVSTILFSTWGSDTISSILQVFSPFPSHCQFIFDALSSPIVCKCAETLSGCNSLIACLQYGNAEQKEYLCTSILKDSDTIKQCRNGKELLQAAGKYSTLYKFTDATVPLPTTSNSPPILPILDKTSPERPSAQESHSPPPSTSTSPTSILHSASENSSSSTSSSSTSQPSPPPTPLLVQPCPIPIPTGKPGFSELPCSPAPTPAAPSPSLPPTTTPITPIIQTSAPQPLQTTTPLSCGSVPLPSSTFSTVAPLTSTPVSQSPPLLQSSNLAVTPSNVNMPYTCPNPNTTNKIAIPALPRVQGIPHKGE